MHKQTIKETQQSLKDDMDTVTSEMGKFLLKQKAEYSRFGAQIKQLKEIKEELSESLSNLANRVKRAEDKAGITPQEGESGNQGGVQKNPY
jgi:predicted  nucleic acid-binding Zn-ribbon protein